MKTDPIHPDDLQDDHLEPALLEALRTFPSEQGQPSPETDAAILSESRQTFATIHRSRIRSVFWPVLAVAACIALAFTLFTGRPDSKPVADVPPPAEDAYAVILREVTAVFPEQVKAIIADGGELRIALADQPLDSNKQAVVVELCENRKCTTVITYVGQTVEVGTHVVTIRLDEKGAIVVDTPDNQNSENPSQEESKSDLQIRTRRI